jgi:hypothetical protein
MGNFTLMYTSKLTEGDKEKINKILKGKKNKKPIDNFCHHKVITNYSDDYKAIKGIIDSTIPNPNVENIILVDYNLYTCYVYKASGNSEYSEDTMLQKILNNYGIISETGIFMGKIIDYRNKRKN